MTRLEIDLSSSPAEITIATEGWELTLTPRGNLKTWRGISYKPVPARNLPEGVEKKLALQAFASLGFRGRVFQQAHFEVLLVVACRTKRTGNNVIGEREIGELANFTKGDAVRKRLSTRWFDWTMPGKLFDGVRVKDELTLRLLLAPSNICFRPTLEAGEQYCKSLFLSQDTGAVRETPPRAENQDPASQTSPPLPIASTLHENEARIHPPLSAPNAALRRMSFEEWDSVFAEVTSTNQDDRKFGLGITRTMLGTRLEELGFGSPTSNRLGAVLAAAKAGYVHGALLRDLLWVIDEQDRVLRPDNAAAVSVGDGHRAVRVVCDVFAIREVCDEYVEPFQPDDRQRDCLENCLEHTRSGPTPIGKLECQDILTRQACLNSALTVLGALQRTMREDTLWTAVLRAAEDGYVSGSLAARILLAIQLQNNISYRPGYILTVTEDDILDGVSAACELFGISTAFPPDEVSAVKTPLSEACMDQPQRDDIQKREVVDDAQGDQSSATRADHARPANLTSETGCDGGLRVLIEDGRGRGGSIEYHVSDRSYGLELTNTDLSGFGPYGMIKALPPEILTVHFVNGLPYFEVVANNISQLDGSTIPVGKMVEISHAVMRLNIDDIAFNMRRIRRRTR